MDVIDVGMEQFQEVEIKGHYGVFTELRVDKSTIPEGVNCYELRHGDDDSYPAALEQSVRVNYFGAVLMTDNMEAGQDGYMSLEYDDFGFTGETLSVAEYLMNYGETEPEFFSGAMLARFSKESDKSPELTEQEADVLIGYMEGHEYLLGENEGKMYRGDLCYKKGEIRWREYSIDDAVNAVCEWNHDLLEDAQVQVEDAENYADYVKKKDYLDSLKADEKLLDAIFDRTKYGKELNELAEKLAEELIEDVMSKGGIDGAVEKMLAAVSEGKDLLPEVSPALKQRSGKAR